MKKSLLILIAIAIGILFPIFYEYTFLIKYSIMTMLFFVFLDMTVNRQIVQPLHWKVLIANAILPVLFYFIFALYDSTIAIAAFLIALAPTAAAAPIIAQLMNKRIEIVAASTLITSIGMALIIPFLLPYFAEVKGGIDTKSVLLPVLIVVFVPLTLAQMVKFGLPKVQQQLLKIKGISLYLFLMNVYLAVAKSTHFIKTSNDIAFQTIVGIAIAAGIVCLVHFQLGEWISRKNVAIESSLALGRKNTMFVLWLSLTFISPVAALSPIFYIIWQNIYNSWQLWRMK